MGRGTLKVSRSYLEQSLALPKGTKILAVDDNIQWSDVVEILVESDELPDDPPAGVRPAFVKHEITRYYPIQRFTSKWV